MLKLVIPALAAAVAFLSSSPIANDLAPVEVAAASVAASERGIAHLLDRIAFGPRPGDVERVQQMGMMMYIERQLHPERLDDEALEARLADFETIDMSTREIAETYYLPTVMERRRQRQEAQGPQAGARAAPDRREPSMAPEQSHRRLEPSPELAAATGKQRIVLAELSEQKLLRVIFSHRQLQEVLVDFWFNHFNVFAGKGPDRILLTEYERDTIRPRVFGKFRELVGAVAESPAMLFYLDNWLSADPAGAHGSFDDRRARRPRFGFARPGRDRASSDDPTERPDRRKQGLNENYARELMELHTLGVDGGYTQQDIVEVARAFTGWTIDRPGRGSLLHQDSLFRFDPRLHDRGEKVVLGHTVKAGGGKRDGEQVLDLLARHPSTARFLATKLARRFVADDPPLALVDRAATRFRETDGDLREVVRAIVTSSEFFSADAYRAKVKTPLEFVASAVRATGARVDRAGGLARVLQDLGMPLYLCQPPTGYADRAEAWVNTGALLSRMNFAVALANNRVPGVTIEKTAELPEVVALTIGLPEFQRR